MKCFNHNEVDAIGTCKHCCKGMCLECLHDTGNGLACNNTCIEEVHDINGILDRSKQIYSIGRKPPAITSGIFMYFFFATMFCGWGVYTYFSTGRNYAFMIFMGMGFLLIGIYAYIKQKKLKLNC